MSHRSATNFAVYLAACTVAWSYIVAWYFHRSPRELMSLRNHSESLDAIANLVIIISIVFGKCY